MLRLHRPPPPAIFSSKLYAKLREELHANFGVEPTQMMRQSKYGAPQLGKQSQRLAREVMPTLREVQNDKCAYCAQPIGATSHPEFELYRPKRGARGFGDHDKYHDTHYWWLQVEWDNMLMACQKCNRFKATWFPLKEGGRRAAPLTYGAELAQEQPLLLNPYDDEPSDHITLAGTGVLSPTTKRGEVTIELLRLNREELVEARRVDEPVVVIPTPSKLPVERLTLEKIVLHNFRNIADLTIEIPQTSRGGRVPWLLLLGENAVGKSAILQAITLTLIGREDLGDGLRDELMYEVIDQLLARREKTTDPKPRPALKKELVEKVLNAWKAEGLVE